jgi:hypothetical protein
MLSLLQNRGSRTVATSLLFVALLLAADTGLAQVPTCDALTLYGNAANSRLCKSLSSATQNLWVCELTTASPDVHTSFNAGTALHVTVRIPPGTPTCQGLSTLAGNWPAALAIALGEPVAICGVQIQPWVDRLNAVPQVAAGGTTACRAGFLAAGAAGRISQSTMQSYLNVCAAQNCP